MRYAVFLGLLGVALLGFGARAGDAPVPMRWLDAWPITDFSRYSVPLEEIRSGGPGKDGIPAIDHPSFVPVSATTGDLAPTEPVIALEVDGDARAYPLRILIWHEVVNDVIGGVPVVVTYCPLCNAAIVFDRRVDTVTLDFGTTGNLRNSDLIMYDRRTESWWQQYMGEAIVGVMTGTRLKSLPSRLESLERFSERFPNGAVLIPNDPSMRPYGLNPYAGYDGMDYPFLYDGSMPKGIKPLARVVAVGDKAWSWALLRKQRRIEDGDLILTWEPGQNSALDKRRIEDGKDVGNVVVQQRTADGIRDVPYHAIFAFVFHAFNPNGKFILE